MIDGWVWGPHAHSPVRSFARSFVVLAFVVQIIDQIFMQTRRRNECKSRQLLRLQREWWRKGGGGERTVGLSA